MAIVSRGALLCWSVETSASSGSVLSLASIRGAQVLSSSRLASCKVYWNWPREMRPPTVMSWDGGRLRAEPPDHLERARFALFARLERDEEPSGIERIAGAAAEERANS